MNNYFIELLRPWKILTFLFGLFLLIYGANVLDFPDWDISISIIMATLTYLTASNVVNIIIFSIKQKTIYSIFYILLALSVAFFAIDSSYVIYHSFFNHLYFRKENFIVSTCLYFICGFVWHYNGSMKDLLKLILNKNNTLN